jgi:GAF domain-containing protein
MLYSDYASNGRTTFSDRVDSAKQGETVQLTSRNVRIQRENAAQHDIRYCTPAVELKSIVAAQRAISREIEVSGLVETLLFVATELFGSERGLVFLAREQGYEIEAEATALSSGTRVLFPSVLATAVPEFAKSVLRYVIRTEERVVLDDAATENQFSHDDYLRSRRLHSILCLPLITQRDLVGALYLENNLAPCAFSSYKLAVLELLVSQAALALKAARLHVDLQHEVSERRRVEDELERFHRMYGTAHLDAHAELLRGLTGALAHELNQPLSAILSNAEAARCLLDAPKLDLEEIKATIGDIIRDNSRAVDTVQNVRAIFQRDAVEMASVDLMEALQSGRSTGCSRTGSKHSSSALIPSSTPSWPTSSGCIWTRRSARWCCALTKSPRFRRSTAPRRSYH